MPVNTKIDIKNQPVIDDLKKFASELRVEMANAIDPVLSSAVDDLKGTLLSMLNTNTPVTLDVDGTKKTPVNVRVSKSKADLIKYIFDEDITKADYFQRSIGNKTVNDNTNVFVYDKGRIKNWQTVGDSSTYAGQESTFRERLTKGILIDAATGNMYKIHPDDVKGIKLECSKDTGETVNSEKKFEAYKQGANIQRRKGGPFTRTAVWTIKQADAKGILTGGLPLNQMLDQILAGNYKDASELLTRNNKGGMFTKAIEQIDNLKKGTNVSDDIATRQKITALINNIKIRKNISDYKTTYTLFSNYDTSIEESDDNFFEMLRQQIFLWKVSNEDALFKALVAAANKVIDKYTSKMG
jgi:hypothetical protein